MDAARTTMSSDTRPQHVAVQMDGNGRWAQRCGRPRSEGHAAGEGPFLEFVYGAIELGVPYLSMHAFTTENWRRPSEEVRFLLDFCADMLRRRRPEFVDARVRLRWLGDERDVPAPILEELHATERATARESPALTLCFCANYGGRRELAGAARAIAQQAAAGALDPEHVDERTVAASLYAPDLPPVDLIIRTGAEQRISNFLLWQSAYAELVFLEALWPDITRQDLRHAIETYGMRERRHGGLSERTASAPPRAHPRLSELSSLPPTLTVEEAGELLGVSRYAAYRAAGTGELPVLRLGRRLLVPTPRLLQLLGVDANESQPTPSAGKGRHPAQR